MDFKLLENLTIEEINKKYNENLIIANGYCGCNYTQTKPDLSCYGYYNGDGYMYMECPHFGKYGIVSGVANNCYDMCSRLGLVDWFYG